MRNLNVQRTLAIAAVGAAVALSISGCSTDDATDDAATETISLGLVPAEDAATVLETYQPFIDYLSESTGYEIDPFVGADYTAVIEALNSGNLDIAWFGPSEYILATEAVDSGIEAFATAIQEEGSEDYRTVFIVRSDSPIQSIEDFAGTTVAFTDPASTSGHIFGRYTLVEAGYEPEELFSQVIYSGSHDASLLSVVNGQVDVAAISSRLLPGFIESGLAAEGDIRIVVESEEIPADPVSYREDLPEDVRAAIADAFLSDSPELGESLQGTGFASFGPVDDAAYDIVRDAYEAAGLEPEL